MSQGKKSNNEPTIEKEDPINMAMVPQLPNDPLEILTPDPNQPEPFINTFWSPMIGGFLGFVGVCFGNFAVRRPVFSGIQVHVGVTGLGAILAKYVEDYRRDYLAERDAVLRHYVQLHIEDFPPLERKKYSEVLEPWYPVR